MQGEDVIDPVDSSKGSLGDDVDSRNFIAGDTVSTHTGLEIPQVEGSQLQVVGTDGGNLTLIDEVECVIANLVRSVTAAGSWDEVSSSTGNLSVIEEGRGHYSIDWLEEDCLRNQLARTNDSRIGAVLKIDTHE